MIGLPMSRPAPPSPAKLVIGMFMRDMDLLDPVTETLEEQYGPVDIASRWLPFDCTAYYEPEMGTELHRRMLSFKNLVSQDELPRIKQFTNAVEAKHMAQDSRRINIDPGYLLPERFVLATGKNFSHRIYIGKDIYADLTLMFHDGTFRPLPWTYPDYAREDMQDFLHKVRSKYLFDTRSAQAEKASAP